METLGDAQVIKIGKNIEKLYYCKICDHYCSNKYNLNRHFLSRRHKTANEMVTVSEENEKNEKNEKNDSLYSCKICQKKYNSRNGLWKHKKICGIENKLHENLAPVNISKQITPELIMNIIEQNKELTNLVIEQNKTIMEISKNNQQNLINSNNINSNNKTFNLNVFLNEHCKDAMNISDFVDSLKLQLSDLENVGRLGFVEGISNIIVKNLQALDIHKRPVHCTDKKREIIYIKDENKWEKEDEKKNKIRKIIKKVVNKNAYLLPEFKAKHPDCIKSSSPYSDQYNKLIVESMGGSGDNDLEKEDKIIKNITKGVVIDKIIYSQ